MDWLSVEKREATETNHSNASRIFNGTMNKFNSTNRLLFSYNFLHAFRTNLNGKFGMVFFILILIFIARWNWCKMYDHFRSLIHSLRDVHLMLYISKFNYICPFGSVCCTHRATRAANKTLQ